MQQQRKNEAARRGGPRQESQVQQPSEYEDIKDNRSQSDTSAEQKKAFKHLVDHVAPHAEISKFSQRFKDPALYMLAVVIITLIYLAYLIYREYKFEHAPSIAISIPINVAFFLSQIIVYFLAMKYQFFQLNFSNIEVILFHVLLLEMSINAGTRNVYAYIFKEIPVIFLCRASYNQMIFYMCLILCYLYNVFRSYSWIDDSYIYSIYVVEYFFFTFICIITARLSNKKEREMFQSLIMQKQLTLVFHNLIKIFHDGVVIADKERILYHNEQSLRIFGVSTEQQGFQSNRSLLSSQYRSGRELIRRRVSDEQRGQQPNQDLENQSNTDSLPHLLQLQLKEAVIDREECKNLGIDIDNNFRFRFNTLDEYLSERFSYQVNREVLPLRDNLRQQQELGGGHLSNEMLCQEINMEGIPFQIQQDQNERGEARGTGRNQNITETKHIQVFTQSMTCNGKETILIALRDMTSWIEIERFQNLNKMKTILFAQAAHEFRNPLNGIISSIDILHDQIKTEIGMKFYKIAKNCANLMLFLVNDILDFAQTEEKKLVLNTERFKLKDLIDQCTNMLQFSAELKGLKIITEIDKSTPTYFISDQNRLRQIMINLLSNAIKYTRKGYIKIKTSYIDRQILEIKVQDTGVGISQEQIKSLFKVFTKIMEDRELNRQGCGLGLSISKKLAEALGGDILVESEKDVGSTFTLQISSLESQMKPSFSGQSNSSHPKTNKNANSQINSNNNLNNQNQNFNSNGHAISSFDPNRPKDHTCDIQSLNSQPHHVNEIGMTFPTKKKNKAFHWNASQFSEQTTNRNNSINLPFFQKIMETEEKKRDEDGIKSEQFSEVRLQIDEHDNLALSMNNNLLNDSLYLDSRYAQVLIADDQPFNLMSLEVMLEQHGLTVDKAFDGESAYQKILSDQKKRNNSGRGYKLIILDNEMPLMSGLQVAIKVRQGQRSGALDKSLKLALSSGESSNEFNKLLYNLNDGKDPFDYNIGKPVNMKVVIKMLNQTGLSKDRRVPND
eukprot:403350083